MIFSFVLLLEDLFWIQLTFVDCDFKIFVSAITITDFKINLIVEKPRYTANNNIPY